VITARVLGDPFGRIIVLQVEDNGPGIPEGERELVFEPFYRVLGNEADGSGLGLPIVLEIARKHRATVHLEDAHPGQRPPGARFSLRFDANDPDEED
jgi:two-component system sensor histidine kinase TctE